MVHVMLDRLCPTGDDHDFHYRNVG
jgi:hypothetical protein